MKTLFFVILFFISTSNVSATELFMEPSLGFVTGSYEDSNSKVDTSGFGISGKAGLLFRGLTGGIDISFTSNNFDNPAEDSFENRQYGIFAGVDLGKDFPFKTWFTFYPYSEFDHKSELEYFGSGYKFGLGFYPWFLSPIAFVFEYRSTFFSEIEDISGRRELTVDHTLSSLYFGVSFYLNSI